MGTVGQGWQMQWGRGLMLPHLQSGDLNGTPTKKRTFRRSLENSPSGKHCCPRLAVPGGVGAHPSLAGAPGHAEQRIGCPWFFHQARRSRDLQNPKMALSRMNFYISENTDIFHKRKCYVNN